MLELAHEAALEGRIQFAIDTCVSTTPRTTESVTDDSAGYAAEHRFRALASC